MNAKANNSIDKVRELQRKLYLSAKVSKKKRYRRVNGEIEKFKNNSSILLKLNALERRISESHVR